MHDAGAFIKMLFKNGVTDLTSDEQPSVGALLTATKALKSLGGIASGSHLIHRRYRRRDESEMRLATAAYVPQTR